MDLQIQNEVSDPLFFDGCASTGTSVPAIWILWLSHFLPDSRSPSAFLSSLTLSPEYEAVSRPKRIILFLWQLSYHKSAGLHREAFSKHSAAAVSSAPFCPVAAPAWIPPVPAAVRLQRLFQESDPSSGAPWLCQMTSLLPSAPVASPPSASAWTVFPLTSFQPSSASLSLAPAVSTRVSQGSAPVIAA